MPEEGKAKGGDPSTRTPARLKQAGAAVGIDFTGKTDRYPNTVKAHTLLLHCEKTAPEKQNQLQEVLFRHYFTDGRYPDEQNLKAAAEEVGLDAEAAMAAVADPAEQDAAKMEAARYSSGGISGVPFFFVNGQPLGSGAQPPQVFVQAFKSV